MNKRSVLVLLVLTLLLAGVVSPFVIAESAAADSAKALFEATDPLKEYGEIMNKINSGASLSPVEITKAREMIAKGVEGFAKGDALIPSLNQKIAGIDCTTEPLCSQIKAAVTNSWNKALQNYQDERTGFFAMKAKLESRWGDPPETPATGSPGLTVPPAKDQGNKISSTITKFIKDAFDNLKSFLLETKIKESENLAEFLVKRLEDICNGIKPANSCIPGDKNSPDYLKNMLTKLDSLCTDKKPNKCKGALGTWRINQDKFFAEEVKLDKEIQGVFRSGLSLLASSAKGTSHEGEAISISSDFEAWAKKFNEAKTTCRDNCENLLNGLDAEGQDIDARYAALWDTVETENFAQNGPQLSMDPYGKLCDKGLCKKLSGDWEFGKFGIYSGSTATAKTGNTIGAQTPSTGATPPSASTTPPLKITPTTPGSTPVTPGQKSSPTPATGGTPGQTTPAPTPTLTQVSTSAPGYTATTDPSGGYLISTSGAIPLGGAGFQGTGAKDTSKEECPPGQKCGGSGPSQKTCKTNSDCPKNQACNGAGTCADISPPKEQAPVGAPPGTETKPKECDQDICLITPTQDSVMSIAAAQNVNAKLQILSGVDSSCRYSVNKDASFASGEKFIEDQSGVSPQHTIFLYYLGEIKAGTYDLYHKCQDVSGKEVSAVQTFTVSESGIDCKIKESGTGATAEVFTDPATGKESCKVIPMTNSTNLTVGDKNITLVVKKNGEPVNEIPLVAKIETTTTGNAVANAPAPGTTTQTGLSPIAIGGMVTLLAGLSIWLVYLLKGLSALNATKFMPAAISYPTVADQQQLAQNMTDSVSGASENAGPAGTDSLSQQK